MNPNDPNNKNSKNTVNPSADSLQQSHSSEEYLTNHDYDDIKEYDNPLPTWWLVTFFGTIIFAGIYYIHYEIAGGASLAQELQAALSEIKMAASSHQPKAEPAPELTEEMLAQEGKNPQNLASGDQIFQSRCASCHGPQLQGLIGPNLTDAYWIHGKGTHLDLLKVIAEGVPEKGMPAWGTLLKKDELHHLVAFVFSKIGSTPPNPKAPEGEKLTP